VTQERERLAEALALERIHGDRVGEFVVERVSVMTEAKDWDGVKRWLEIAEWLERLQPTDGRLN
jgi:hypothetical protein